MKLNELFKKENLHIIFNNGILLTSILLLFFHPKVIAQTPDLFATSFQTDAVNRFNGETGEFMGNFVTPGSGGLDQPQEVFFHPNTGHLLVTGFFNNTIKVYDGESGEFISDFSSGYTLSNPTKIILGADDLLYVSQWDGKVVRFNLDGTFVDEFTDINIPAGLGMEWDDNGNLYVAGWGTDGFDGKVERFDSEGNHLGTFINSDILNGPVGLWQDDAGDFFIMDWRIGSVLRFDSDGNFIETFISVGERVEGHAFGEDGSIYISNVLANKVTKYNPDGSFIETFIDDSNLAGSNAITFGPLPIINNVKNESGELNISLQFFPNPISNVAHIQFNLPQSAFIVLKILDNSGREIFTLKEAHIGAGKHTETWDASTFPSGAYFVQLSVGEKLFTERMVLPR